MGISLSHYELIIRLAGGGGANVFLARDTRASAPGRLVAVKVLLPALARIPEAVEAFFSEAQLASRLRHPNIVSIAGFGESEGVYGLAMEYVFGESMAHVLNRSNAERKPLTVCAMLEIVSKICGALHYAHELRDDDGKGMQLVHRDISPENVLLGFDGVPKLTDFGIAKVTNRGWETQAGIVKGKARYMSPEQLLDKKLDRRSDVFLLGIVLWEALTGRPLFRGSSVHDVVEGITSRPIEPPSVASPGLPPVVDSLVMRALRRPPSQRYATADEMRSAIDELLDRAGIVVGPEAIANELGELYGSVVGERAAVLRSALDGSALPEAIAEVMGGSVLDAHQLPHTSIRPGQSFDFGRPADQPKSTPSLEEPGVPAKTEMVLLCLDSQPPDELPTPGGAVDLSEVIALEPDTFRPPASSPDQPASGWRDQGETMNDDTTPLFLMSDEALQAQGVATTTIDDSTPTGSGGEPVRPVPAPSVRRPLADMVNRAPPTIADDDMPTNREMPSFNIDDDETIDPVVEPAPVLSEVRRYIHSGVGEGATVPDSTLPPSVIAARDEEADTPSVASMIPAWRTAEDAAFEAIGPQAPGYAGLTGAPTPSDDAPTDGRQPVIDDTRGPSFVPAPSSSDPTRPGIGPHQGPTLSWPMLAGVVLLVFVIGLICGLIGGRLLTT